MKFCNDMDCVMKMGIGNLLFPPHLTNERSRYQNLILNKLNNHLVYENILTAIVGGNKTPAFGHIEPFAATPPCYAYHTTTACIPRTYNVKNIFYNIKYDI